MIINFPNLKIKISLIFFVLSISFINIPNSLANEFVKSDIKEESIITQNFTNSATYWGGGTANTQNVLGKLNNPYASEVNTLAEGPDNTVFAGTWGDGIYRSSDLGESFVKSASGLDSYNSKYINEISFNLNTIFIATNGDGVYKSVDNGNSWVKSNEGIRNLRVMSVLATGTKTVYASTKGDGVFRSTDNGDTWNDFSKGLFFQDMGQLFETPSGSILVATWEVGVFRLPKDSIEAGNFEWERASSGIYRLSNFRIFATSFNSDRSGNIYVGTLGKGIFSSEDDGKSWIGERVDALLDQNITAFDFTEDNEKDNLITGTRNWGCWYWVDNGGELKWKAGTNTTIYGINDLIRISDGNYICATTAYGVMKTTGDGKNWETKHFMNTGFKQAVEFKNNMIFASGDFYGLQRSTDFGLTWAKSLDLDSIDMVTKNETKFVAISIDKVAISDNDGISWTKPIVPIFHDSVGNWGASRKFTDVEITKNNTILLTYIVNYGTSEEIPDPENPPDVIYGIFQSTDNGQTWVNNQNANSLNKHFEGISSPNSNQIYAINKFDSIYISTNSGISWTKTAIDPSKANLRLSKVESFGNRVLVGTWDGLYLSSDNGFNFLEVDIEYVDSQEFGLTSKRVESINMDNNLSYQVGLSNNAGLYITSDASADWDSLNPSYAMSKFKSIASNSDQDKIYGGIGIYKYTHPDTFYPPSLISPANGSSDISVEYPNKKGQEKPVLKWGTAKKADMYEMQISANELFSQVQAKFTFASTSWTTNFDFEYNTTYYWKVRSKSYDSYSRWSEVYTFTTELEATELVSPTMDEMCINSSTTFSWNTSDSAETYQFEISDNVGFSEPFFETQFNISNTFTTVEIFPPSSTFWWRVRAKNNNSTSPWSNTFSFVTSLASPTLTFPADSTIGVDAQIDFQFAPPSDAQSAFIEIYRDAEMTDPVIKSPATTLNTHITDLLEFNICYWWRLKSLDDDCDSDWSDLSYFCTGIAPPNLFLPVNGAFAQELDPKIRWDNFSDANSYFYELSNDNQFSNVISSGTTTELSQQINGLDNFTNYYWRVRVIISGDNGAWSEVWTFRTKMGIIEQTAPLCSEVDVNTRIAFKWNKLLGAESYNLQVSDNFGFNSPIINLNLTDSSYKAKMNELDSNTKYYWRVQGVNSDSLSNWTPVCDFTTQQGNSVDDDIINNISTTAYPNPFNKTLTIDFTLIAGKKITINIYDATGLKVVNLLDAFKLAGDHSIEWTPQNLSAGVYYYQINVGTSILTKELIHIK